MISWGLTSMIGVAAGASVKPIKFLIQPKKPFSAGAGAAAGAVRGAALGVAATGVACLGWAAGAGASGKTPLMMGSCLFCFSWLRRVTVVGSSISSAIL